MKVCPFFNIFDFLVYYFDFLNRNNIAKKSQLILLKKILAKFGKRVIFFQFI